MTSRCLMAALSAIALTLLLMGCSNGSDPISPDQSSPETQLTEDRTAVTNPHHTWGMWQVRINSATAESEIIPLRSVSYHLDTIPFIETGGGSMLKLSNIVINGPNVDVNVGLTHPFPGQYQWSGLDVRGIFISDGSFDDFQSDGDLVMSETNEPRLLNADGWTRWWNAREFPISGSILGYTDGIYGVSDSQVYFRNTLNPYKYFSDDLGQGEDFPYDLDFDRRGLFTATTSVNWRHYTLDFGESSEWYIFNYAVDANHKFDDSYDGHSTPGLGELPDPFFPLDANMPEAFAVTIKSALSTLYYVGPGENGGDLVLTFDIYDWQGIFGEGEYSEQFAEVRLESPELVGSQLIMANLIGQDDPNFITYQAVLGDCHPDGLEDQEVLISVFSIEGDYNTGYDGYSTNYSGHGDLAAHLVYYPDVSPEIPPQQEILQITSPNGGEVWVSGDQHDIKWTSLGQIDFVTLEYTDDGGSQWYLITDITSNDGTYELWDTSSLASSEMLVRISDAAPSGEAEDESDGLFAIDSLTLDFPNVAGDDFEVDVSGQYIEWTIGSGTTDVISNIDIEFSKNGGASFAPLQNNVAAGSGQWEWVPVDADETIEGRIRITAVGNSQFTDTSDENFEVYSMAELTYDEYKSYFTDPSTAYRGRTTNYGGLSTIWYDGTQDSWDFTGAPFNTYLSSGSNFTVTKANGNNIGRHWGATWFPQDYGMRISLAGPQGVRPWWVFYFNDTFERVYPSGSDNYRDAELEPPNCLLDMQHIPMTEWWNISSTNLIQFPLTVDNGTQQISGSGMIHYEERAWLFCDASNMTGATQMLPTSRWDVLAEGSVTDWTSTVHPHCLLMRVKLMIEPQSSSIELIHKGQIMYQWVDCDTGDIVAFLVTHNEEGYLNLSTYTHFSNNTITGLGTLAVLNE